MCPLNPFEGIQVFGRSQNTIPPVYPETSTASDAVCHFARGVIRLRRDSGVACFACLTHRIL